MANKILTTHVGSLPRVQEVVDFIFKRETGELFDRNQFDETMRKNVDITVAKQVEAGIDIVSDGETSKISYATCVKDRYTGFSGDSPRNAPQDLKLFPDFLEKLASEGGTPEYARPMCTSEVQPINGNNDLAADIDQLTSAVAKHSAKLGSALGVRTLLGTLCQAWECPWGTRSNGNLTY